MPKRSAKTFGEPVAFILINKSIRLIVLKSTNSRLNYSSEEYFHWVVFILNDLLKQIYQSQPKLSAQKEIKSYLKVVKADNQQDLLKVFFNSLPQLQMYAFSFLNNLCEAEDVTASVIEKLILVKAENDSGFNSLSETELVGYLKVTIRNACIDLLRRRKVKRSALSVIGTTIQFWKRPEAYDKFQLEAFDMLLLELSPREREILELHLKGLKNDDISEQLGLSSLTVRNTLHNAKKRVRKLWNIFMR